MFTLGPLDLGTRGKSEVPTTLKSLSLFISSDDNNKLVLIDLPPADFLPLVF